MRIFDCILEGYQLEGYSIKDYVKGMVWCEIETSEQPRQIHSDYEGTIDGIEVYYCYGADHYWFADAEPEIEYGYFEVIPTMCGDSFACTTIIDTSEEYIELMTKEAIQADIDDINDDYQQQIKDGEREEGDEYEGYPQYGYLEGDLVHYCDEDTNEAFKTVNWRDAR